jgi:hypothetical protein
MTLLRALCLTAAVVITGCRESSRDCTQIALVGLNVTVMGAGDPDGGTITVTATDGDYVEELSCAPQGESLVCAGATERPGRYLIEVIAGGDVVASKEVTVGEDECHVIPEDVSI